jgi:hypothetical protein
VGPPVWAGRHKFTNDGLVFVPFILGDCLDDALLLDFEDGHSPGSPGLGGQAPLAGHILDPQQVLESDGHLTGDLLSIFPIIPRSSQVVDEGDHISCGSVDQIIPFHHTWI